MTFQQTYRFWQTCSFQPSKLSPAKSTDLRIQKTAEDEKNTPLLLCVRNEGMMPPDPRLENFETSLADILQANTVQTLEANLHFLNILDDPIKKVLCEQQTGQFYSLLED